VSAEGDHGASTEERPRVVLVTGDPGTGKSTLGRELSQALRVPFLARDDVRGGLFLATGAWSPHPRRVPTLRGGGGGLPAPGRGHGDPRGQLRREYVVRRRRPAGLARIVAVAD
jgi:hypothetical protein